MRIPQHWRRVCWSGVLLLAGCAAHDEAPRNAADPHAQLARALERDVRALAEEIGVRDKMHPAANRAAADYVEAAFRSIGRGSVAVQTYDVDGAVHQNVCFEIAGSTDPDQIVVIGAHHDTATGTPGADDNASGVAGMLALARRFADPKTPPARTVRFVAFDTEEPPHTRTPRMGSYHYARSCRERNEKIVAMLSIEMIGFFSDEPGSQKVPPFAQDVYPDTGNFLLFAGDTSVRAMVADARDTFADAIDMPAYVLILPVRYVRLPMGANSSDQWSFWQFDYPGIMVTDTANWRNPHYHQATDTPGTLDYDRMATVVEGLEAVVRNWLDEDQPAASD